MEQVSKLKQIKNRAMKLIIFPIVTLVLFYCNQNESKNHIQQKSTSNDSIKKNIPAYKDGGYSVFYRMVRRVSDSLNLKNLDNGFDSLQIRVWFPEMSLNKLLIISKHPDRWEAIFLTYTISGQNDKHITYISSKNIEPMSEWNKFTNSLFSSEILTLPDCCTSPGSPGAGADAQSYSVEVSTSKSYKFYTYCNPFDNRQNKYVDQFAKIIELLRSEFPQMN